MESLDLRGYDLVVSSSSAWAHGVIPDEDAVHVCYCHNPFRYAWNAREETLAARGPVARAALRGGVPALAPVGLDRRPARRPLRGQLADDQAARRALLRPRGDRAAPAGRRSSASRPAEPGDAYVVLSELMPHKRIEVAVRAFNGCACRSSWSATAPTRGGCSAWPGRRQLRRPRQRRRGRAHRSRAARALVVTATEEFGIAAVEAQAAGRPGDRAARGRRARDGDRGRDGHVLRHARARGAGGGRAALRRRWPSTPPRAWPTRGASTPPISAAGCGRRRARARRAGLAPRGAAPAATPRPRPGAPGVTAAWTPTGRLCDPRWAAWPPSPPSSVAPALTTARIRARGRSPCATAWPRSSSGSRSIRSPAAACARRSATSSTAPTAPIGCAIRCIRTGPKGEGAFERVSWDEALGAHRRAPRRDRRRARRRGGAALQLLGHPGARAGRLDGPALLRPPGRLPAGADDLRAGGGRRAARGRRHARSGCAPTTSPTAASSCCGGRTRSSPTCTNGRSCRPRARPGRGSS